MISCPSPVKLCLLWGTQSITNYLMRCVAATVSREEDWEHGDNFIGEVTHPWSHQTQVSPAHTTEMVNVLTPGFNE